MELCRGCQWSGMIICLTNCWLVTKRRTRENGLPPWVPPDWIDADERVFLEKDLNHSLLCTRSGYRCVYDRSAGQTICTAVAVPRIPFQYTPTLRY
jgi:hypothetical protein